MTPQTLPARLLAAKFRKRPLVIEAIQYIFDGTTRFADEAQDDIADFMGQNIVVVGDNIEIQTPEGPIYASPGDWIIRGVAGEFYPCKPDIFTATYEAEAAAALSVPESLEAVTQLEWSATLCDGKNVDYATAEKACAALGEGWRLPTRLELESILDLTRYNPCADTEVFPDTESDWYWSSTITAWSSDRAWYVSFDYGDASYSRRDYSYCCVRAVRSLPSGQ